MAHPNNRKDKAAGVNASQEPPSVATNNNMQSGEETDADSNNKKKSASTRKTKTNQKFPMQIPGRAYSCTGLTYYSAKMQEAGNYPLCVGVTGRTRDVEILIDKSPGPVSGGPPRSSRLPGNSIAATATSVGSMSGTVPLRQPFTFACLGYSQIFLEVRKNNCEDDATKEEKVFGMPHCEFGLVSLIAAPNGGNALSDEEKRRLIETQKRKLREETARQRREERMRRWERKGRNNSNDVANEKEEDELSEEDLDKEISRLRQRARQVIERNEMDPQTWKRREQQDEHGRKQRNELGMGGAGLDLNKVQAFMVKIAVKTVEQMRTNAKFIVEEVHDDLPRRVYKSSQRIVGNFGRTADLCSVTVGRCRESVVKAYKSWKGDEEK